MYTELIGRNILNPCMNLLRDARQRVLSQWKSAKISFSMIIGLNNQRRSYKLKEEKSEFSRTCIMKKEKKGLLRKMIFFMTYRSWSRRGSWEKFAYSFIYGFCSISPKTISLRRNKTHENALYKPCVFTEDKWCSMIPIFVLVSLLFLTFLGGKEGALELII